MNNMHSFASRLAKARKNLNLTIDEVSEKTKIRHNYIQAFEDGNFNLLPEVYTKPFLKNYAKFLKIPDNELNQALDEIFSKPVTVTESKEETSSIDKPKEKDVYNKKLNSEDLDNIFFGAKPKKNTKLKAFLKYLALSLSGIAFIVIIIVLFIPKSNLTTNVFTGSNASKGADTTVLKIQDKKVDKFTLAVVAKDSTVFKIHIDNLTDETVALPPKGKKEWKAEKKFELSAVTVGSVEFYRDGFLLPPFGNQGSVIRNITITKDNVTSSSMPVVEKKDTLKKTQQVPPENKSKEIKNDKPATPQVNTKNEEKKANNRFKTYPGYFPR